MAGLLCLCYFHNKADLPPIWVTIDPLSKEWVWVAMKSTCRTTAERMRFRALRIPNSVAVIVLALKFYTNDPDGVGYALNIFLLP